MKRGKLIARVFGVVLVLVVVGNWYYKKAGGKISWNSEVDR